MNSQKVIFGFCAAAILMSAAHGQNLIQNSTFDTDILGWDPSGGVSWSNQYDHDNYPVGTGGALQISTLTTASASQCVNIDQRFTYILSMWVGLDPRSDFAPCSDPKWFYEIEFMAEGPQCSGDANGFSQPRGILMTPVTSWTNQTYTFTTAARVASAVVKLNATCRSNNGAAIVYFDDVTLTRDTLFRDGFDDAILQPLEEPDNNL